MHRKVRKESLRDPELNVLQFILLDVLCCDVRSWSAELHVHATLSLFNLKRFYGAQRKSHIHCWKAHLPILFSFTVPSTWSSAYVGAKTCEFGTWSWVPHRSVPLDPILSPCILFASTLLILLYRSIAEHLHRHRPVGIHALYDSKYLCRVRKRAFGRGLCVVGREKENISCALFVFFPF